jgi:hypothetical protein
MATDYVTDGKIGIDLTAIYASTSAGSTTLFPVTPGTTVITSNNGRYIFARAESDIAQYDCVIFSTYSDSASLTPVVRAVPITTTNAAALGYSQVGLAQVAITSSYYGWIALNGQNLRVNCLIACNPKVPLYTTSTAGKLDDTTVSAGYIQGIVINTSATSASAPFCIFNNGGLVTSNPV